MCGIEWNAIIVIVRKVVDRMNAFEMSTSCKGCILYGKRNQITAIIDAFTHNLVALFMHAYVFAPQSMYGVCVCVILFRWIDESAYSVASNRVIDTDCDYIKCNALGSRIERERENDVAGTCAAFMS